MSSLARPTCKRILNEHLIELRYLSIDEECRVRALGEPGEAEMIVFFEIDRPFELDALIQAKFCLPYEVFAYRVQGVVLWIARGSDGQSVLGIGVGILQACKEPVVPAVSFYLSPGLDDLADSEAAIGEVAAVEALPGSEVETLHLPTEEELSRMLDGILGASTTVHRLETPPEPSELSGLMGTYQGADGRLRALSAGNRELCCCAGGAMILVPPEEAQQAIQAADLDENLGDFFEEVLNILASLLSESEAVRLRLEDALPFEGEFPEEWVERLPSPSERFDFQVEIPDYGAGILSILLKLPPDPEEGQKEDGEEA